MKKNTFDLTRKYSFFDFIIKYFLNVIKICRKK